MRPIYKRRRKFTGEPCPHYPDNRYKTEAAHQAHIETKKLANARRHAERMINDLDYRMRKLLNTIRQRCLSGKGRKDWEWYGAKGLEVTITVEDLKALWWRDRADTMKRPSIDRINSSVGYVLSNCRFIEHADNLRNMISTRRPRRWHKRPGYSQEA